MTINQELSKGSQDGNCKKLPQGENGKNIHWDAKGRRTGMKIAKRLINSLARKSLSSYPEHGVAERLINTQQANL